MPSTVTSFTIFVSGTKARASQVNSNMAYSRGTRIPMNEDTATASHQTHDLGSTEHNWRRIYLKEAPYINNSQLGKIRIDPVYDGVNPPEIVDYVADVFRIAFPKNTDTDVRFTFLVPDEYTPGNRLALRVFGYPEVAGTFSLTTVASLYKASVTSATTTATNSFTGTASWGLSTAGLTFVNTDLKLSNASGLINSVTITAGDKITVNFKRKGSTDSVTGYLYVTDFFIDLSN